MDQGVVADMIQKFMMTIQAQQTPPGGGMAPPGGGLPPGQDAEAALAQQGMGPMPMGPGAPVQDPNLMGGPQAQQMMGMQ
jgi:hypothetical protein